MAGKTAKLVTEQRVIELLACYGGDAASWPDEERAAAAALIKNSTQLRQRQREARELDERMGLAAVRESLDKRPDSAVVAGIVNALAAGTAVNLSDRRQSAKRHIRPRWYYSVAAAAVMVLAVGIMMQYSTRPLSSADGTPVRMAAVSADELDVWMWREATGSGEADLVQEEADQSITFLAMVELLPDDE